MNCVKMAMWTPKMEVSRKIWFLVWITVAATDQKISSGTKSTASGTVAYFWSESNICRQDTKMFHSTHCLPEDEEVVESVDVAGFYTGVDLGCCCCCCFCLRRRRYCFVIIVFAWFVCVFDCLFVYLSVCSFLLACLSICMFAPPPYGIWEN